VRITGASVSAHGTGSYGGIVLYTTVPVCSYSNFLVKGVLVLKGFKFVQIGRDNLSSDDYNDVLQLFTHKVFCMYLGTGD